MEAVDGRLLVPNGSLTLHAHSVVHAVSILESASRTGNVAAPTASSADTKRLDAVQVHNHGSTSTSATAAEATVSLSVNSSAASSPSSAALCPPPPPPPSVGCPPPAPDTVQRVELALQGRSACLVAGAPVALRSGRLRAVGRIVRLGSSAARAPDSSSSASASATCAKNTTGCTESERAASEALKADSKMQVAADELEGLASQLKTLLKSDGQVVRTAQSENNNHHISTSISLLN